MDATSEKFAFIVELWIVVPALNEFGMEAVPDPLRAKIASLLSRECPGHLRSQ
jgi:hypothetical protein